MEKATLLEEMDRALEAANHCSEKLEKLLKEAKSIGRPTPELVERISSTNKECDGHMRDYVDAYRSYYNMPV